MIGWITENNDYAFGGIANLNLFDDNVRIEAAGIYMDINYKFYGVGSDAGDQGIYLDVNQSMPAYYAKAQYQILPNTYLGLGYMGANVDITYSSTSPYVPPGILPISDTTRMAGLEIPFQYDTRDDQQYPRQGWLVDASSVFYREDIGSDFNAESYNFAANKYLPVRGNDVLALRASTQATSDDAPVFLMSSIGGREDMRGYAFGRYTDKIAYSLQADLSSIIKMILA